MQMYHRSERERLEHSWNVGDAERREAQKEKVAA